MSIIFYQLLEAIGALTKDQAVKANSHSAPYQDAATESVSASQDDLAVGHEDETEEDNAPANASIIGQAVFKVRLFCPCSHLVEWLTFDNSSRSLFGLSGATLSNVRSTSKKSIGQ